MDEKLLAYYMGHGFSHALHVQTLLATNELMVPYVIYWQDKLPHPIPYPAPTQQEAVQLANEARERQGPSTTGWTSGREGSVAQPNGSKLDVVLVEGWVPALTPPLQMFVYCRKEPFRLLKGFLWQTHPLARKDARTFMEDFKQGIQSHSFGQQCLTMIDNAEPVTFA
jgi:hypothetical protein